jgi:hypothetical protein
MGAIVASVNPFLAVKDNFFKAQGNIEWLERNKNKKFTHNEILDNARLIDDEVATLYTVLRQNTALIKKQNDLTHVYFLYFCVQNMKTFYETYQNDNKKNHYTGLEAEIKSWLLNEFNAKNLEKNIRFLKWFSQLSKAKFLDILRTPLRTTKIREKISHTNLYRIYWVFCHLMVKQSMLLAKDLNIIAKLDAIFGSHTDVDGFLAILDKPNNILNVLSVGFYATRLIINLAMLAKHAIGNSKNERDSDFAKRLAFEWNKRKYDIANDVVWGSINLITNYYQLFNIPLTTANWIVAGVLVFDVVLLQLRRQSARKEYLANKEKYIKQIKQLETQFLNQVMTDTNQNQQLMILRAQLSALEDNWKVTNSTYWFNMAAASCLLTGFSAALLLSNPVLVLLCFSVGTFGCAMYASDGEYAKYKKALIDLENAKARGANPRELKNASNNLKHAKQELIVTLVENTLVPLLILTTFAVCWQAGIALVAVFAAYKLISAFINQKAPEPSVNNYSLFNSGNDNVVDKEPQILSLLNDGEKTKDDMFADGALVTN